MLDITVIIDTPQELNHASYMHSGLYVLERMGILDVKVNLCVAQRIGRISITDTGKVFETNHPFPKVSYYTIKNNKTGRVIRFAADLYDHAECFSDYALKHCNYYFKRSYNSRFIEKLPVPFQGKIHCLGLAFGVKSNNYKYGNVWFWGVLLSQVNLRLKPDRLFFKRLTRAYKWSVKHWRFIKTTRPIGLFEDFKQASQVTVFFQTRCFEEKNDDVVAIHKQRYHIIKLLQKQFPKQFQGGFVSGKVSENKYADALTNVPSEPVLYLKALKEAKIVIYTRGLANSPAWKMAEYLSQGKVIIAEPLRTELPYPLIHGTHVLYFNSDEELISHINTVLKDDVLCKRLSANARQYFEDYVHPAVNIKRILDVMILNA
ncbi:glycosyltransferase [Aestuariibaculum suncheonense]|uniref:Glycosyltransferase family 1 protein n=1 Tax=Aestuariibaculum suncheonense TaxID=1028745 RepID=A0A8J6UEH1_9FLAO|nr:glycosyltransferase [Aestuariibaculum suncheonense]MBD0837032.1 glycosyltransferase family 1 protein [Aestuariibaculum suncheonense]